MKYIATIATVLANRIRLITRFFAVLAFSFALSLAASGQIVNVSVLEQFRAHDQHFSCTAEYAPAKCVRDLRQLHRLLEKYNADSLGEWQWVVVSRSEWKPFCEHLGVDFLSPAMTSFVDHQAFFDEGLFDADPRRSAELVRKFGTTWKELLPLAVTHELGHAVCHDATEARAELFAEDLRRHRPGRCESAAALRAAGRSSRASDLVARPGVPLFPATLARTVSASRAQSER